jgi:hypothetical protein
MKSQTYGLNKSDNQSLEAPRLNLLGHSWDLQNWTTKEYRYKGKDCKIKTQRKRNPKKKMVK